MRAGDYVPSDASWRVKSDRVGFECAGTVEAVGANVWSVKIGDRVMAQVGGACAELVAVDAGLALPCRGLREEIAAAFPSGLLTEYDALDRAGFHPGDDVLVTAASSGVGRIGVQLAEALGAGTVMATTRTRDHVGDLRAAGADVVVDTKTQTIDQALGDAHHHGCGIVLDHVGGQLLTEILECAPPRARIVQIGRLGGDHSTVDLSLLASQRLTIIGTTFRGRELDELRALVAKIRDDVRLTDRWATITPTIDRVYDLDQPEHAARRLRQGRGAKVVLRADRLPSPRRQARCWTIVCGTEQALGQSAVPGSPGTTSTPSSTVR